MKHKVETSLALVVMCKLKNAVILVFLLYEFCISCGYERLKKYRYVESYTNRWSAKIIGHTETAHKIAKIEGFKVIEVIIFYNFKLKTIRAF